MQQAHDLYEHYTYDRLVACGLSSSASATITGALRAINHGGPETWRIRGKEILDAIGADSDTEGLRDLIEFAQKYAGPPGHGDGLPPTGEDTNPKALGPSLATDDDDIGEATASEGAHVPEGDISDMVNVVEDTGDEHSANAATTHEDGGSSCEDTGTEEVDDRESEVKALPIDSIVVDKTIQPRLRLDPKAVEDYAQSMADGGHFPPVVVFSDFDEEYILADGFHRVAAAKEAGLVEILVEVRFGNERDARLFAVGANATHGLRRTNADKRKAVTMLLEDEEWGQWSDREIARLASVSHTFVSKVRAEANEQSRIEGPTASHSDNTGEDGLSGNGCQMPGDNRLVRRGDSEYEMDVSGIGKKDDKDTDPGFESAPVQPEEEGQPKTQNEHPDNAEGRIVDESPDASKEAGIAPDTIPGKPQPQPPAGNEEPTGREVLTALLHAIKHWVGESRKERKPVGDELFREAKRALDDGYPGFYERIVAPVKEQWAELEAVKAEVGDE
jgi:hypothetical protein